MFMGFSNIDPDDWFEEYYQSPWEKQYEMIMQVIDNPFPEELTEDGMFLTELKAELEQNNRNQELAELIEELAFKQPDFYKKEFTYFDDFLVEYYLYLNQPEKLEGVLNRLAADPVSGIELLIFTINYLVLYGHTGVAVALSEKTYKNVEGASDLIKGAGYPLSRTVYDDQIDKIYHQIQAGKDVNWQEFGDKIREFDFTFNAELQSQLEGFVNKELPCPGGLADLMTEQGFKGLYVLSYDFGKYMLNNKQVDFTCSNFIWVEVVRFWTSRNLPVPVESELGDFFDFEKKTLESHISKMYGQILSQRQANAVALLWGIPYIYEFLWSKNIIMEQLYFYVIEVCVALKKKFMHYFKKDLWKYDFVHRWTPPNAVLVERFDAEKVFFNNLFNNEITIGDDSYQDDWDDYLDDPPTEVEKPRPRIVPKVGRNDPCICGSGKKYKKCCGV